MSSGNGNVKQFAKGGALRPESSIDSTYLSHEADEKQLAKYSHLNWNVVILTTFSPLVDHFRRIQWRKVSQNEVVSVLVITTI